MGSITTDDKLSISAMSSRRPSYAAEFSGRQAEHGTFAQTFGLWDRQDKPDDEVYEAPLRQLRSKSLSLLRESDSITEEADLYMVEFKACRLDVFYLDNDDFEIRIGDLVIVEGDRGKDLGKVVQEGLTSVDVSHAQPKPILRLAEPEEVAQLLRKGQLEAEALAVCRIKVQARDLPMEVVDAEYQWDMKKLTFYYIASQRIDFRELVKDLFKIYKTRIWMCAVNSAALWSMSNERHDNLE